MDSLQCMLIGKEESILFSMLIMNHAIIEWPGFHAQQLRAWNTDSTILSGLFVLDSLCLLEDANIYKRSILWSQAKIPKKPTQIFKTLHNNRRGEKARKKTCLLGGLSFFLQNKYFLTFFSEEIGRTEHWYNES